MKLKHKAIGVMFGVLGIAIWVSVPLFVNYSVAGIVDEYKTYLFLLNLLTAAIAYVSFFSLSKNSLSALVLCALYTWMPYRISLAYGGTDLKKLFVIAFVPLFFMAIGNINLKESFFYWIPLTLAMTVFYQLEPIVFVASFLASAIVMVGAGREKFRQKWIQYVATLIAFCIGNGWTMIQRVATMVHNRFEVLYNGSLPVQAQGNSILDFLTFFWKAGSNTSVTDYGLVGRLPSGGGIAVTGLVLFILWVLFTNKYDGVICKTVEARGIRIGLICGGLFLWMSLTSFPWDILRHFKVIRIITTSMENPREFTPFVVCSFLVAVGLFYARIGVQENRKTVICALIVFAVIGLISTQYLIVNYVISSPKVVSEVSALLRL